MKLFYFLPLLAIVMVACSSKEQKAEALIKDVIVTNIYKPDTYKPVKTVVVEAYSPYDDPDVWQKVKELKDMALEIESLEIQVKYAMGKLDEINAKLKKKKTKRDNLYEEVTSKLQAEPAFIGYKAIHNFRADDNAGNTLIGNVVAIIDKDMKHLTGGLELEGYDEIQRYIKEEILKDEE